MTGDAAKKMEIVPDESLHQGMLYNRDAQPAALGPDPAPEGVLSCPRSRLKKKRLLNEEDFINEFKHH